MVARPSRILGDASHAWTSAAVRLVACTGRSKSSASRESSRYAARASSQLRWPAVATLVEDLRTLLPPGEAPLLRRWSSAGRMVADDCVALVAALRALPP
ncbi:hypothetical protein F511_47311 [Dorcoceras hygrometricum]|uniref:Uncharacterized protein n=1 Tax=Dorcoceras hygrometricum TaxID=472368 RepID=A0A2Z6ZRB7_9LAMI|nr:hypothetical protein F511_47311 [Dorcoceras hygrometricum]